MAPFTFALLTFLTASLASAGPVALDNSTLLLNGQQALVLNCQFQSLQLSDPCNSGDTACLQNATATCVNGTWQTLPCPSSKSCFALPEVRTNGTFIACTSPNNAASIIAATGIQAELAGNCTSVGNSTLPFSPPNNTAPGDGGNNCTQGGYGTSSTPATIPQPSLTLPPTTTTLPPGQAISLISSLSASPTVPSTNPSVNLGGNAVGVPPVILLTSILVSSPAPTPAATPSGGYSD